MKAPRYLYLVTIIIYFSSYQASALDQLGNTPLMLAAENGNLLAVKQILGEQDNINHKNIHGYTALMLASMNLHYEVINELIAGGADKNLTNKDGLTAADLLEENQGSEMGWLIFAIVVLLSL